MTILKITSPANPTIKELARLKDRKTERSSTSFVTEGFREISRALQANFEIENFYYCPELLNQESGRLASSIKSRYVAELSKEAFEKVAIRENSDGILAVLKQRQFTIEDILRRADTEPLLTVAIENVEKPGNLGALLRTADAVGAHGVIVLGHFVDLWNQNVIRSSLGAVFSVPVLFMDRSKYFDWCRSSNSKTFAAALSERSICVFDADMRSNSSIILGSEAHGLSRQILESADVIVKIPMRGICDSLNISVAAGILMYESLRQRSQT